MVLVEEGRRPAKGADRGEASKCFCELCVERGLGLKVEESNLAGGTEVVLLQDIEGDEADRYDGADIGST